jgi:hypothetical protein
VTVRFHLPLDSGAKRELESLTRAPDGRFYVSSPERTTRLVDVEDLTRVVA